MMVYSVDNNIDGTVCVVVEVEEDDTTPVEAMRYFAMGAASAHTYAPATVAVVTYHYGGHYTFTVSVQR